MTNTKPQKAWLILGDQLFHPRHYAEAKGLPVFMAEDEGLCTHFRYHKQKLVLFLASMRHFRDEMQKLLSLDYHSLEERGAQSFEEKLGRFLQKNHIDELHTFEISDRFFEEILLAWCASWSVTLVFHPTPSFLTSRDEFQNYLGGTKRPFMKVFYERQRKKTGFLMDKNGEPLGGQFSFDEDNRKPFRFDRPIPAWPKTGPDKAILSSVQELVNSRFKDHPGETANFRWPVSRPEATAWLQSFLKERLSSFGDFEDSINQGQVSLFHSLLSPLMNLGWLTPAEVLEATFQHAKKNEIPLNSLEGFVRQVMGWREFIFGIDQHFGVEQEKANFFRHDGKMADTWWTGKTGVPVLDDVIRRVLANGYCHHIERLMVLSNLMLLSGIHPQEVHRWFMELFVDSADWVMGPNVYGMGQFSDGGIFATKPYICGSSYLLKMSDFSRGPWCEEVDGLYWSFIRKHRLVLSKNHRMKMMVAASEKIKASRWEELERGAAAFLQRNVRGSTSF